MRSSRMRPPIRHAEAGTGLPVTRVAAVFSIACGAIMEFGIYHDADKGYRCARPGKPTR